MAATICSRIRPEWQNKRRVSLKCFKASALNADTTPSTLIIGDYIDGSILNKTQECVFRITEVFSCDQSHHTVIGLALYVPKPDGTKELFQTDIKVFIYKPTRMTVIPVEVSDADNGTGYFYSGRWKNVEGTAKEFTFVTISTTPDEDTDVEEMAKESTSSAVSTTPDESPTAAATRNDRKRARKDDNKRAAKRAAKKRRLNTIGNISEISAKYRDETRELDYRVETSVDLVNETETARSQTTSASSGCDQRARRKMSDKERVEKIMARAEKLDSIALVELESRVTDLVALRYQVVGFC